jgi:hypothetical protein
MKCFDVNVGRSACQGAAKHKLLSPHYHLVCEQVKPWKNLHRLEKCTRLSVYCFLPLIHLHVDNAKISQTYILLRSIHSCLVMWRCLKECYWIRFDSWQKTRADLFHVNCPTAQRPIQDRDAYLHTNTPKGHFGASLF